MSVSSPANKYKSIVGFDHRPIRVKQCVVRKATSEHISSTLRRGVIPWKNEIVNDKNSGLPLSISSREPFNPINTLLLQIASHRQGFAGRWWGTRSKWQEIGGIIDESTWPTFVLNANWSLLEVFCVDQISGARIDGYRVRDDSITNADDTDSSLIEELVESGGADVRIGVGDANHSALEDWYVPPNPWVAFPFHTQGDYILLQRPELRLSLASHCHTLLHELVHWSEVRTNWIDEMPMRELVAEIGSGWLASKLGCPPCPCRVSHDKWLERWLWEISRDETYISRATEQARRACQFLMSILAEDQLC